MEDNLEKKLSKKNGYTMIYHHAMDLIPCGNAQLIFYWLCRFKNSKSHSCYPTLATLFEKSCLSRSTIHRAINLLCKLELVNKINRTGKSSYFIINLDKKGNLITSGASTSAASSDHTRVTLTPLPIMNPCHTDTSTRVTLTPPPCHTDTTYNKKNIIRSNINNKKEKDKRKKPPAPSSEDLALSFDKFWKAYPRKQSKKKAKAAFLKLKPNEELMKKILTAIDLQTHAAKEKNEPDWKTYCPLPATWLNGERWEDEVDLEDPKNLIGEDSGQRKRPRNFTEQRLQAGEDLAAFRRKIDAEMLAEEQRFLEPED